MIDDTPCMYVSLKTASHCLDPVLPSPSMGRHQCRTPTSPRHVLSPFPKRLNGHNQCNNMIRSTHALSWEPTHFSNLLPTPKFQHSITLGSVAAASRPFILGSPHCFNFDLQLTTRVNALAFLLSSTWSAHTRHLHFFSPRHHRWSPTPTSSSTSTSTSPDLPHPHPHPARKTKTSSPNQYPYPHRKRFRPPSCSPYIMCPCRCRCRCPIRIRQQRG